MTGGPALQGGIMADILAPRPSHRHSGPQGRTVRPQRLEAVDMTPVLRGDRTAAHLASLIEAQIIPRLMLAHARTEPASAETGSVGRRTLDAFARMALASEAPALTAYAETLMRGGLSLEGIYLELLAPTARRLGDDWNDDLISFTDVTLGLSRLQQVVRALGGALPIAEPGDQARAACFAPFAGEQHTFGLVILEECFRRAGWRTSLDTGGEAHTAADTVAADWFDLIGLSASSDATDDHLRGAVARVRAASMNPALFVMVGGRLFLEDATLAARIGADGFAGSATDALSVADDAVKPFAFA